MIKTTKDDGFNAWIDKIFDHVHQMKGYEVKNTQNKNNEELRYNDRLQSN